MFLLLELTICVTLMSGSIFFALAETALTSVSLSTWDRLQSEKPRISTAYRLWSQDPSLVLATLLFGNTLTGMGASIVASLFLKRALTGLSLPHALALSISAFLTGVIILVFCEILPKLYARHHSDKMLLRIAVPLVWLTRTLQPLLKGIAWLADALKRLMSRRPSESLMTADELRQALSDTRSEALAPSARRILSNLIGFEKIKVRDVMVPRSHMVSVRMEKNSERVFEHIVRSGFSRIPVYFGNIDNLLGIVYAKDLLVEWRSSGLLVLEDLLRPPYRIAPDAPLSALLQGFRQGHHMAIVTDEAGRTQGIVTIEDAVETIVGDIADEFDQPQSFDA